MNIGNKDIKIRSCGPLKSNGVLTISEATFQWTCNYKLYQVYEINRGAYWWPTGCAYPTDIVYFGLHSVVVVVLILI